MGGGGGAHDHTESNSLIQNKFSKSGLSNNGQDIVTALSPPVTGCLLKLKSLQKGEGGTMTLEAPLAEPLLTDLPVI